MSSSPIAVFTRLIVTAPSEKIADVYFLQLESLKSQLPCLQGCVVYCVHDPSGFRVGSGGGTLNAIDYLLCNGNINFQTERILIIHSGGDSRRAPLYSLCGKAWTTVNSTIGSSLIANPLALLIKELSNFCAHLPYCSLVVASSDVMLHISHLHSGPEVFASNAVSVVSVSEKPHIAKNHGVLAISMDNNSKTYMCCPALNYLQKPSIECMTQESAIYEGSSGDTFALIDTGVVIFTGEALLKFSSLAEQTGVSNCTTRVIESLQKEVSNKVDVEKQVLRIELYSDILLAFGLLGQTSTDISIYLKRLNVPTLSGPPSSYLSALPIIWETLCGYSLHVIHVVSGRFNHLGTTEEVLQLLLQTVDAQKLSDESHGKLSYFAEKYNLRRAVRSVVESTDPCCCGVAINSFASYASWSSVSLTEHSLLTSCSLGENGILSHIGSVLGTELVVNMNTMMQQVFLKETFTPNSPLQSCHAPPSQCALLVMNILDDVKKDFNTVFDKNGVVMGSSWSRLFAVSGASPGEIWAAEVPQTDRALWNAKLFSKFRSTQSILAGGDSSTVEILIHGEYKVSSKLTLTWLQDLKNLECDKLDESLSKAIAEWRSSERVSLSDLLSCGDAKKMFFWRLLLQTAFDLDFGELKRTSNFRDKIDSKQAMSYIFECINDLFRQFELELLASGVPNLHSAASSAVVTLWCLQLLVDLQGSQGDSTPFSNALQILLPLLSIGAIERIVAGFIVFQSRLEHVKNAPESSTLVAEYLKRLLFHQSLLGISRALLHATGSMTTLTHPRALFLVSWLLKDSDEVNKLFSGHEIFAPAQLKPPVNIGFIEDLTVFTQSVIWQVRNSLMLAKVDRIDERRDVTASGTGQSLQSGLEAAAQAIVSAHVQHSLEVNHQVTRVQMSSRQGVNTAVVVLAESPVRIDLAGGWSDTPPICYEMSGAVLNVAITVDGKHPIRCASRVTKEGTSLRLVTVRDLQETATDSGTKGFEIVEFRSLQEIQAAFKDTQAWYSLLLAVLIVLGVVDFTRPDTDISDCLKPFLSPDTPCGLEIGFISTLPAGSGMGGSSVLAATILMSVGTLLGLQPSNEDLVYQVSQVEQVLTTGGGWQDQVGAIYGGFKIARSPKRLPLQVSVVPAHVSAEFIEAFQRRTHLVYTGRQRLAKNTLINALRKCALIPVADPHNTVTALLQGAERGFGLLATQVSSPDNCDDMVDALAATLNEYWTLKKEMAAGSEPGHIRTILDELRPLSEALSLCGAGAGGFAVVILKRESSLKDLEDSIDRINGREDAVDSGSGNNASLQDRKLSIHSVQVDSFGTKTTFFDEDGKDVTSYIIIN